MFSIVKTKDGEILSVKGDCSVISIGDTVMYKGNLEGCETNKDIEKYLMYKVKRLYIDNMGQYYAFVTGTGSTRNAGDVEMNGRFNLDNLWVITDNNGFGFKVNYINGRVKK